MNLLDRSTKFALKFSHRHLFNLNCALNFLRLVSIAYEIANFVGARLPFLEVFAFGHFHLFLILTLHEAWCSKIFYTVSVKARFAFRATTYMKIKTCPCLVKFPWKFLALFAFL
jgi:hypothetical protein